MSKITILLFSLVAIATLVQCKPRKGWAEDYPHHRSHQHNNHNKRDPLASQKRGCTSFMWGCTTNADCCSGLDCRSAWKFVWKGWRWWVVPGNKCLKMGMHYY